MVETDKFYFFDTGVSNFLARREPKLGSAEFGKSFEQFILMELLAFRAYRQPEMQIFFWRTSNRQEVDFILDDKVLAFEIKSSVRVHDTDAKSLTLLAEDGPIGRRLIVSQESTPRIIKDRFGSIEILPWKTFLQNLWSGEFVSASR